MKLTQRIRVTNIFDPSLTEEVEAVVDTDAIMLVLPQDVVDRLNLRKFREATVRYANGEVATKSVYGVVTVEILGRAGEFDVLAEVRGSQALIGHMILEQLDLVIHPATGTLAPNPESPDMPTVEILQLSL